MEGRAVGQHGSKEVDLHLMDIDPSLCTGEPLLDTLDDGFSPRLSMHSHAPTHPAEPDPYPPATDNPSPNPTQLPVEPEFGQALPQAEPEDPTVKPPVI
jgi:hypothetical protein